MKKLLLLLFLVWPVFVSPAQDARDKKTPKPTPTSPPPVTLEPAILGADFWQTPASQFAEAHKDRDKDVGFHWLSDAHDAVETTRPCVTFLGLSVVQSVVRFQGEKITGVDIQLYNRGDAGELDRPAYEALVKQAVSALSNATRVPFAPRGRDASGAVRADGVTWATPQSDYLLEYSATKAPFRAEFVRLQITPSLRAKGMLAASFEASRKAQQGFQGPSHVTRDPASGDVAIKDVPMVDQGEKGYCVVAACERLFRYYGIKSDANELAQLANSSAMYGTSLQAMMDSLKKLTSRLKIHVRNVYEIQFQDLIADYAKEAKKSKEIPLNTDVHTLGELYAQAKPDVLRAARARRKGDMDSFQRNVKTRVGEGVPLLWGVILGVLPDGSKTKVPGGHMRLIIGYNEKTNEILYSDTWGLGHELKRMPLLDAWAITTHVDLVEPF
jgi:hypothetical protein